MSNVSEQCSESSSVHAMDIDNCTSHYLENNNTSDNGSDRNVADTNILHAFQESLAASFVQGNLTHAQGNIILKTLRSLPYLSYLPRDTRTLLKTPFKSPIISKIDPGEYLHIGFATALIKI